jgi:hypothetical protein
MRTFKYVGQLPRLEVRSNTLVKDKPFETDNPILIAALENDPDVIEVKPK